GSGTMTGANFPGAVATQLDPNSAPVHPKLWLSPDENHLAIMDVSASSFSCSMGSLSVASVVPGCAATVHYLASASSEVSLAFSADSRPLLFLDGVTSACGSGSLKLADGDGANVTTLAPSVVYARLSGGFAVWITGSGELKAAPLGGTAVHLGT